MKSVPVDDRDVRIVGEPLAPALPGHDADYERWAADSSGKLADLEQAIRFLSATCNRLGNDLKNVKARLAVLEGDGDPRAA